MPFREKAPLDVRYLEELSHLIKAEDILKPGYVHCLAHFALVIEADTGLRLRPVQYERIARAAGNAQMTLVLMNVYHLILI